MINRLLPSFELEVASLEWQLEMLIREGGWHHRSRCLHLTLQCHTLVAVRLRCVVLQALHLDMCEFLECVSSWNVFARWKCDSRINSIRTPINPPLQSHFNPYHAAYFVVHFVANHLLFAIEVLVYLDASLQEVWIFAELQICLIRRAMSKIPVSFERLPNMAPFDILLALLERPWLWNICPSLEGHLVWIVQNFKTLSVRFATPIPRSFPLTTIIEHLRSHYRDGLRCCWMRILSSCRKWLHNLYPRARSPKLKKK